jgi:CelD/BcsL family acetyltransferase involved in cellulose biosynthesis
MMAGEDQSTAVDGSRKTLMDDNSVRIEVARSLSQLRDVAAQWDFLVAKSRNPSPMSSHAWISSYLEHMMSGSAAWYVLLAFESESLVGILPVIQQKRSVAGIGPNQFVLPSDDHTISVDVVVSRAHEDVVADMMIQALMKVGKSNAVLSAGSLPETSPLFSLRDRKRFKDFDGYGSYLKIDSDLDACIARLSSNFRKNLRKSSRKLEYMSGVRFRFVSSEEDSEEQLNTFCSVEASGWKGSQGTAIMSSPQLFEFYKSLVGRLAEAGWLEWHFLECEKHTIAAHMAVRIARRLTIIKIGYDEDYRYVSPGNMLLLETIRRSYGSGKVDEIDCITDMKWNENWKMEKRKYYNLRLYSRGLRTYFLARFPMQLRTGILGLPLIGNLVRKTRRILT